MLDGQQITQRTGDPLGPLADGEHHLRIEATNAAGRIGFAEVTFTVDTVAPMVAITSPATGVVTIDNPLLTYSISDGTVTVMLDGTPIMQRAGDLLGPLADGEHLVRVEATDAAGNVGLAEVVFTVDTAPVPGLKTLTLGLDAGGGVPIAGANAYLFDAAGVYLSEARVTDAAGQAVFSVDAGSYTIRCDYLGYQFLSALAVVTTDTGLALTIPHHTVTIGVSGSYAGATQAKPSVPVYLFTETGSYLNRSATTDAQGQVSFSLPERGYKARADYLGFMYWSGPLSGAGAQIVIPEAVAMVTVTKAGGPVPATPVYVFAASGAYLGLSGTTNAAGQVSFQLPAQAYRFRADYLGTQYFSDQVTLPADQVTAVTIVTGGGIVNLTVHNGTAGAVTGAVGYLFTEGGTYLNVSRTTDATGLAAFDLTDGSYKIRVDYLGASIWTAAFTVPGTESLALDLGGGTLTLGVDRGGGTPIVGAATYLFDAAGTYLGLSEVTDSLGQTHFTVPGGSYKVRCDYLGYQFWSDTVTLNADATLALSIPHSPVNVSVLGAYAGSNEPRANRAVHLFTAAGSYLGQTLMSDAGGQVQFDLPARDYKLRVDDLGFSYWSEIVTGDSVTVTIPEAIAEVVVTRGGLGVAGVPVYLLSTTGSYLSVSGITAAGGIASFRLPAQTFRFRADNSGEQFFSGDVTLAADQVIPVPIALGGGTFTLTVSDGATPLSGVACYLFDGAGTYLGASQVSGADGEAQFELANGVYDIRADYLGYQFWTQAITVPTEMSRAMVIARQDVPILLRRDYAGDLLPVPNAPVYLFDGSGGYLGESRTTDGAGQAVFAVPQQSYQVRADYLGASYWSAPFVWSPVEVTIAEGLAEVTVTLAGMPLGGAPVYVYNAQDIYLGIAQTTDGTGQAHFRLPAGGYHFAADVLENRYFGAAVIAAGQVNQVTLSAGGAVFGMTVDDGAGGLLGGVPVYLFSASGNYLGLQQTTDAQGHVAFTLSDGQYLLGADYRGYQFWTSVLSVPAQTSALLSIPHGLARIHVTAAGVDIGGAVVYLFDVADAYLVVSGTTDSAGIAEFSLPGRNYTFRADYQDQQHWSPIVTIVPGTTQTVEIDAGE